MSHLFSLLLFCGCTAVGFGRYYLLRRREQLLGQGVWVLTRWRVLLASQNLSTRRLGTHLSPFLRARLFHLRPQRILGGAASPLLSKYGTGQAVLGGNGAGPFPLGSKRHGTAVGSFGESCGNAAGIPWKGKIAALRTRQAERNLGSAAGCGTGRVFLVKGSKDIVRCFLRG